MLLLVAALAGHVCVWVAVINRVHGRAWRCRTLQRWRNAIVAVNLAVPVVLAAWVLGGTQPELSTAQSAVLGILSAGLLLPFGSALRYWQPAPSVLVAETGERFDVSGDASVGDGPVAALAKLPGNEFREIELTRKTLALPSLMPGQSLRILHLTDWHFTGTPDRRFYERATELCRQTPIDLVLFTGDLIDRMELLDWIEPTLGTLSAPLGCWFILGNHDWMQQPEPIRQAMVAAGWSDLAGRVATLDAGRLRIQLGGSERPWMGEEPSFGGDGLRVALMHTPDRIGWAVRNGCDLALAGHNHGGQVRLPGIGPLLVPARSGTRYAGGVYDRDGCVLHVGRGLGSLHPLRWNCPPEIAVLTLQSGQKPVG